MKKGIVFDRRSIRRAGEESRKEERVNVAGMSWPYKRGGSFSDAARLDSLVSGCRRMLLRISAIFPFDLFPDEIIVDECKVSIVFREFFFSEDIHSINIEMIRDVDVETGPFFAKLQIVPDGYPGHPLIVRYLKKKDAYKARSVIQGLMVAKRNNIDLAKVEDRDLADKLELLGKTHVVE